MFIPSLSGRYDGPREPTTESATSPNSLGMLNVSDDIAGIFLMFGLLAFYGMAVWDRWKQIRAAKNERLVSGRGMSALRPRIAGRSSSYGTMKTRGYPPRSTSTKPQPPRRGTPKVRATQPNQKKGSLASSPAHNAPNPNLLQVPSRADTPIST